MSLKNRVSIVTRTDALGTYKVPGFGKEIDPKDVEVACDKDGYQQLRVVRRSSPSTDPKIPIETECTLQRTCAAAQIERWAGSLADADNFILLIAFTAFAAAAVWSVRTAAQSQFGDPNAQPAPFNPQMAALMSMLIQPRHAKLGLAGKAENWPLAAYALKELRQGFVVAARAVPRWKGLPVPDLFDAAVAQPLRRSMLRSSSSTSVSSTRPTAA